MNALALYKHIDFSSWWQNRESRDAFERAENEKLEGDIRRTTKAARRNSGWSGILEKTKKGMSDFSAEQRNILEL